MGIKSIIAKIEMLPPLPESVRRLDEAFHSGDPAIDEIVSIVQTDPLLTANILAMANAPSSGIKNRIISVMQAITLFGHSTVRGFALKAAMERHFELDLTPYGIVNEDLSKISMMQNALMFQWYMGVDIEKAKILIPLAFIMETGKALIAREAIEKGREEDFLAAIREGKSEEEAELEFVGATTAEVGALLFRHWNFDEMFVVLMEQLAQRGEDCERLSAMGMALKAVRSAVNISEQLSESSIEAGCQIVREIGKDPERFAKVAQRVAAKFYE